MNSQLNEDIFKSWTPNMAWLLGYIYADGCISKKKDCNSYLLSFDCKLGDIELLEFIKEFLDAPQKIRKYLSHGVYFQCCLRITSYEIVKDLVELHGLKARKSYLDLPFPNIPDEYLNHFVRGYFDGDGCISQDKRSKYLDLSLCGTRSFMEGVVESVFRMGVSKKNVGLREGGLYIVRWGKRLDIRKFHSWFYRDRTKMYLKRKEELMRKVFELKMKHEVA